MDFVHDQLATGHKLRVLTIVDTFSRFSPVLEPRFTFRAPTFVVEVLERVDRQVGLPATIRVDQGTEFVSRDLDLWAYQRGVTLDFSRPGKPTDNAFIEAFNGRFRAIKIRGLARKYYNEERPHSVQIAVSEHLITAFVERTSGCLPEATRRRPPRIPTEPRPGPRPRPC